MMECFSICACACVFVCLYVCTHTHLHVVTCMHKANLSIILHCQSINPTTTATPYISIFIWNASNRKVTGCAKNNMLKTKWEYITNDSRLLQWHYILNQALAFSIHCPQDSLRLVLVFQAHVASNVMGSSLTPSSHLFQCFFTLLLLWIVRCRVLVGIRCSSILITCPAHCTLPYSRLFSYVI